VTASIGEIICLLLSCCYIHILIIIKDNMCSC